LERIKVAIVGPGNIGSDLMYKVLRSQYLQMELMAGIIESEGIRRASGLGIRTTIDGIGPVIEDKDIHIVFDSTGAKAHAVHAPLLLESGKIAVDLTPAAIGPYVVPPVNLESIIDVPNFNMVTCGGQATIPIVHAVERVAGARYAEIVACISSKSAGPGTRQNIDEFTQTTARGICQVGGAKKGKAIIILNPAEPPLMMTNTVYVEVEKPDEAAIRKSVEEMVSQVQSYVPGYRLRVPPILDGNKVTVIIQVEGAGDFLPKYSGNLDIMNSSAIAVAERVAAKLLGKKVIA
jgi:acetaldehyde dehydrogenase (acetylating)